MRVRPLHAWQVPQQCISSCIGVDRPSPHRAPTVPPPPPSHRLPRLEDQPEAMRARQREMFRLYQTGAIHQASNSESDSSSDSGEYTIRDGSLPSPSNFEGQVEDNEAGHSNSGGGTTGYVVAATVISASSLPQAEGASIPVDVSTHTAFPKQSNQDLWLLTMLACGMWGIGFLMACCCLGLWIRLRRKQATLDFSPNIRREVSTPHLRLLEIG